VLQVQLRQGDLVWDKGDRDIWFDDMKTGKQAPTQDVLLARL
jgi:hypothetical protein